MTEMILAQDEFGMYTALTSFKTERATTEDMWGTKTTTAKIVLNWVEV